MFDFLNSPFGGILGLVHVVLVIYALINILGSNMSVGNKILWFLVVAMFPIIGLLIYLAVKPTNA